MRDIVGNMDVVAEEFGAEAIGKETAAITDGGGAEVAEHLANEVENSSGLQDYCVAAGSNFLRIARQTRFF